MTRTVQITDIDFDLTLDDDDAWELDDPAWELDDPAWELDDPEMLQEKLQKEYIGRVFQLDVPDDATDDEICDELLDEVSDLSGWCINSIRYNEIPN